MSRIGASYARVEDLDLKHLRYFRAVAATRSITRAAVDLRVSQPTLSVAMRNLERQLGTSLLLRGPRGVALTRTGEELLRASSEVLLILEDAADRMRGLESDEVGRFVIGCYHSFGAYFLPELMRGVLLEAPGIELSLWHGTADDVRNAVVDRVVHFGVAVSPRPHPDLVIVELFRDVMGVFVERRHPRGARGMAAFRAGQLLHVERILSSRKVVDAMRAQDLLPRRVLACGDLELVKSLAFHGVGAAVLPYRVGGYNLPRGGLRLLAPRLPFETDTACVMYRADLHRTRAALRIKDALVRRGRDLDAVPLPLGVRGVAANPR